VSDEAVPLAVNVRPVAVLLLFIVYVAPAPIVTAGNAVSVVPPIVCAAPVKLTVPDVFVMEPPLFVQLPFTVTVPVLEIEIELPLLSVIEPALLNVTVPELMLRTPLLFAVMFPGAPAVPTVSVCVPTVSVAVAEPARESRKVIVLATLTAVNDGSVAASGILTSCAVVGTRVSDQFDAVLQLVLVPPIQMLSVWPNTNDGAPTMRARQANNANWIELRVDASGRLRKLPAE